MAVNVNASASRRNWSREETMMAFALYIVLEPCECDDKGLDVQRLASFLRRTPSSVALKIWHIAAYGDNRKARGRVGMKHGSKLDSQVWQWYAEDPRCFHGAMPGSASARAPASGRERLQPGATGFRL